MNFKERLKELDKKLMSEGLTDNEMAEIDMIYSSMLLALYKAVKEPSEFENDKNF